MESPVASCSGVAPRALRTNLAEQLAVREKELQRDATAYLRRRVFVQSSRAEIALQKGTPDRRAAVRLLKVTTFSPIKVAPGARGLAPDLSGLPKSSVLPPAQRPVPSKPASATSITTSAPTTSATANVTAEREPHVISKQASRTTSDLSRTMSKQEIMDAAGYSMDDLVQLVAPAPSEQKSNFRSSSSSQSEPHGAFDATAFKTPTISSGAGGGSGRHSGSAPPAPRFDAVENAANDSPYISPVGRSTSALGTCASTYEPNGNNSNDSFASRSLAGVYGDGNRSNDSTFSNASNGVSNYNNNYSNHSFSSNHNNISNNYSNHSFSSNYSDSNNNNTIDNNTYNMGGNGFGSSTTPQFEPLITPPLHRASGVHHEGSNKAVMSAAALTRQEDALEARSQGSFDWTTVYETNQRYFGYHKFRPGQRSAIHASLTGRDAFVLMPTGGGKSLCYQVPALISQGVTIVISPLVSLIQDQVMALNACGVKAAFFLGQGAAADDSGPSYLEIIRDLHADALKLLYVTPEKIAQSPSFVQTLQRLQLKGLLARFVIDEAHCVSQWGHAFRSDYLRLNILRENFRSVPILALTATATKIVISDVINVLGLRDPEIVKLSFNRVNLRYKILPKKRSMKENIETLANYVSSGQRRNQCGIIYCFSRKETEDVCFGLQRKLGAHAVTFYHAGIADPQERQSKQNLWSNNKVRVIVATIAFGMGINKPDVRYVVHFTMPKSITNFYQESGRGGRDGKIAECAVMFQLSDKTRIERLIRAEPQDQPSGNSSYGGGGGGGGGYGSGANAPRKVHRQIQELSQMTNFCLNKAECRRALICEHFNETFDAQQCNKTCDNCADRGTRSIVETDATDLAKALVQCAQMVNSGNGGKITMSALTKTVRGVSGGARECPQFGNYKTWKICDVERVVTLLFVQGVLEEYDLATGQYTNSYLRPGSGATAFLQNPKPITIRLIEGGRASSSTSSKGRALPLKRSAPASSSSSYFGNSPSAMSSRVPPQSREFATKRPRSSASKSGSDFRSLSFVRDTLDVEDNDDDDDFVGVTGRGLNRGSRVAADSGGADIVSGAGRTPSHLRAELLERLHEATVQLVEDSLTSDSQRSRHWLIFSDDHLQAIACALPLNLHELGQMPGIGPNKASTKGPGREQTTVI
ncbi:ATP-dependent helicase SGS1 [Hondaea fermentalgiana]|uniref:DNA 3'-5' helicase n=1 Tax=Hondaea fermentalgiana TaxID=2315210 RepID=A0A2R5GB67_9STRA|nr:ATP-dependent helicase SGS1 [Hondaea fermentalgiana]|eukprot:GBG26958.1 ATP-dependent helicase SGS1 [Hondaea fermentalgiana]